MGQPASALIDKPDAPSLSCLAAASVTTLLATAISVLHRTLRRDEGPRSTRRRWRPVSVTRAWIQVLSPRRSVGAAASWFWLAILHRLRKGVLKDCRGEVWEANRDDASTCPRSGAMNTMRCPRQAVTGEVCCLRGAGDRASARIHVRVSNTEHTKGTTPMVLGPPSHAPRVRLYLRLVACCTCATAGSGDTSGSRDIPCPRTAGTRSTLPAHPSTRVPGQASDRTPVRRPPVPAFR